MKQRSRHTLAHMPTAHRSKSQGAAFPPPTLGPDGAPDARTPPPFLGARPATAALPAASADHGGELGPAQRRVRELLRTWGLEPLPGDCAPRPADQGPAYGVPHRGGDLDSLALRPERAALPEGVGCRGNLLSRRGQAGQGGLSAAALGLDLRAIRLGASVSPAERPSPLTGSPLGHSPLSLSPLSLSPLAQSSLPQSPLQATFNQMSLSSFPAGHTTSSVSPQGSPPLLPAPTNTALEAMLSASAERNSAAKHVQAPLELAKALLNAPIPGPCASKPGQAQTRVVVEVAHDAGTLAPSHDGVRWQRYGRKIIKDAEHPRVYYKCTVPGCEAKKQLQVVRVEEGGRWVTAVSYENSHNHPCPRKERKGGPQGGSAPTAAAGPRGTWRSGQKVSAPAAGPVGAGAASAAAAAAAAGAGASPCRKRNRNKSMGDIPFQFDQRSAAAEGEPTKRSCSPLLESSLPPGRPSQSLNQAPVSAQGPLRPRPAQAPPLCLLEKDSPRLEEHPRLVPEVSFKLGGGFEAASLRVPASGQSGMKKVRSEVSLDAFWLEAQEQQGDGKTRVGGSPDLATWDTDLTLQVGAASSPTATVSHADSEPANSRSIPLREQPRRALHLFGGDLKLCSY